MSTAVQEADSRVLVLLCAHLPGRESPSVRALTLSEWSRIGTRLRQAGLSRPGELLHVRESFWVTSGLEEIEVARLQALLARRHEWVSERERLAGCGIRVRTIAEPDYPSRLRERLRGMAPPVLFGAGNWELLNGPSLAIVGSRQVDEDGAAFTAAIAGRCAMEELPVVTGGARGVDQIAMTAALERGGSVIAVPSGDLEGTTRKPGTRDAIDNGRLLLLSPSHPKSGFCVANAMRRNKVVYALADWALVVASAFGQGGTWAGAREALCHGWVPIFVRDGAKIPEGNRELLRPSARPFPAPEALGGQSLRDWLASQALSREPAPNGPTTTSLVGPSDLFELAWPSLAGFLTVARSPAEVAAAFCLELSQARAWLLRAHREGRVDMSSGPRRFQLRTACPAHQLRLLEAQEQYDAHSRRDEDIGAGDLWGCPAMEEGLDT